MSKHTPGPWTHYDDSKSHVHRHEIVALGKTVARIYCTNGDEEEDAANARLISAAPQMLEALQTVLNIALMDKGHWAKTIEVEASAAIAAAIRARSTNEVQVSPR